MKQIKKQILNNINNAQDCNWYYVNDRQIDTWLWYEAYDKFVYMKLWKNIIEETLEDETN